MFRTIKDIWYALTSPEKYRDFMNYKKRDLLLYVLVLILFSGIITIGIPASGFMTQGGFRTFLEKEIPDFTISSEDGLWIEEPIEIDEYNVLVNINSDIVRQDITDLNGQYGNYDYVLMADQEQVYMKVAGGEKLQARFDEFSDFSIIKEDIFSYLPMLYLMILWGVVLAMLMDYGYYLLTAFVISWGAGVIASFLGLRLGNKKLFSMSVYAGTFSFLLALAQNVLGKSVPNFTMFSLLISTGYMYFALKDYKDSGIQELPPEQFSNREG